MIREGVEYEIVASRIPLLRNTYVLVASQEESSLSDDQRFQLLAAAFQFGQAKSAEVYARPGAFTLIVSGLSSRRASTFHVHIVLNASRWRKCWFYFVLSAKNFLQAVGLRRDSRN